MRPKEFSALIALLEDPDSEVYSTIADKLVSEGTELILPLEKAWESSVDELLQRRLEDIIHRIQLNASIKGFSAWINSPDHDLLEGIVQVAKFQYPDINHQAADDELNRIKQKVWLELNESLTALEKVKILNHTLFDVCGFSGNSANFFSPQNHFVNMLLETKRGGPVLISIFYSLVAQRLGLPIYPVSFPKNFIVAYVDRYRAADSSSKNENVIFYVNPFNHGALITRREIEQFLIQSSIPVKDEYFLPCSNQVAVSQLIASLLISYQKSGSLQKMEDLKRLLDLMAGL